ncbi:hypothetical protein DdX_14425 [Ditylenchus destructor]|uniref:Uncharacterized protein n=1 Tax=Ditylenchus destructor TaxID=166010 RepID=A0AAD4MU93_9BILA|nr:hypothetical protein DdX_14425 [Ditylenchus destructor]
MGVWILFFNPLLPKPQCLRFDPPMERLMFFGLDIDAISTNALQFFYRYLVLCRDLEVSPLRYMAMLSVSAVPVLFYVLILYEVCYPEPTKPVAALSLLTDVEIHEKIDIVLLSYSDSLSWYLHCMYAVAYNLSCYTAILPCFGSVMSLVGVLFSALIGDATYSLAFITLPMHWIHVLNPLIAILAVKTYRRTVFRMYFLFKRPAVTPSATATFYSH